MRRPHVEILYVDGCPNHEPARALVERVAAELRIEPVVDLVRVPDAAAATRLRFLGSPTVRVDGRDVEPGADEPGANEPGADERSDFALACRVYRGSGEPDSGWIRDALKVASDD